MDGKEMSKESTSGYMVKRSFSTPCDNSEEEKISSSNPRLAKTPPLTPKKVGKMLALKIHLLDDTVTIIQAQTKALGRVVFEQICKQLNVLEADYFGLEYTDSGGTSYWLDLEKRLSRQMGLSLGDPMLRFGVKFYTPDPSQLEEEFTRYLFSLQIKRDLASGILQCNDNTAALMASYIVQAECGDFNEDDYPDATYLTMYKFIPHQDYDIERKIRENHKKHIGQSPAEADLHLLETARRTELFGIRMHPAKDEDGVPLNLTVCHLGILVFQNYTKINTFSWAKIRKLSFKRKRFILKLHPEGYGYYKELVEFIFETRNDCKSFWKRCVEHHAFFRCERAPNPIHRSKGILSSRGSSFRYSGRTQKQMVQFVRENFVKRNPNQHSQPARGNNQQDAFHRSASFRSAQLQRQSSSTNVQPDTRGQLSGVSTSCSSPAMIMDYIIDDRTGAVQEIEMSPLHTDSQEDNTLSAGTSVTSSPQRYNIPPLPVQGPAMMPQFIPQGNTTITHALVHSTSDDSTSTITNSQVFNSTFGLNEFPVTTYKTAKGERESAIDNTKKAKKFEAEVKNKLKTRKQRSKSLTGNRAKNVDVDKSFSNTIPRRRSNLRSASQRSYDTDDEEEDLQNLTKRQGDETCSQGSYDLLEFNSSDKINRKGLVHQKVSITDDIEYSFDHEVYDNSDEMVFDDNTPSFSPQTKDPKLEMKKVKSLEFREDLNEEITFESESDVQTPQKLVCKLLESCDEIRKQHPLLETDLDKSSDHDDSVPKPKKRHSSCRPPVAPRTIISEPTSVVAQIHPQPPNTIDHVPPATSTNKHVSYVDQLEEYYRDVPDVEMEPADENAELEKLAASLEGQREQILHSVEVHESEVPVQYQDEGPEELPPKDYGEEQTEIEEPEGTEMEVETLKKEILEEIEEENDEGIVFIEQKVENPVEIVVAETERQPKEQPPMMKPKGFHIPQNIIGDYGDTKLEPLIEEDCVPPDTPSDKSIVHSKVRKTKSFIDGKSERPILLKRSSTEKSKKKKDESDNNIHFDEIEVPYLLRRRIDLENTHEILSKSKSYGGYSERTNFKNKFISMTNLPPINNYSWQDDSIVTFDPFSSAVRLSERKCRSLEKEKFCSNLSLEYCQIVANELIGDIMDSVQQKLNTTNREDDHNNKVSALASTSKMMSLDEVDDLPIEWECSLHDEFIPEEVEIVQQQPDICLTFNKTQHPDDYFHDDVSGVEREKNEDRVYDSKSTDNDRFAIQESIPEEVTLEENDDDELEVVSECNEDEIEEIKEHLPTAEDIMNIEKMIRNRVEETILEESDEISPDESAEIIPEDMGFVPEETEVIENEQEIVEEEPEEIVEVEPEEIVDEEPEEIVRKLTPEENISEEAEEIEAVDEDDKPQEMENYSPRIGEVITPEGSGTVCGDAPEEQENIANVVQEDSDEISPDEPGEIISEESEGIHEQMSREPAGEDIAEGIVRYSQRCISIPEEEYNDISEEDQVSTGLKEESKLEEEKEEPEVEKDISVEVDEGVEENPEEENPVEENPVEENPVEEIPIQKEPPAPPKHSPAASPRTDNQAEMDDEPKFINYRKGSIDEYPLPPPPLDYESEYNCETPRYPPPEGFDFSRRNSAERRRSSDSSFETILEKDIKSKRSLTLQRTFSVQDEESILRRGSINEEPIPEEIDEKMSPDPPEPLYDFVVSECKSITDTISSDKSNSPEMVAAINFRTLSRISEMSASLTEDNSTNNFLEKIECGLRRKLKSNSISPMDFESAHYPYLKKTNSEECDISGTVEAPLVTLTSELADSSATLNDLEEIFDQEVETENVDVETQILPTQMTSDAIVLDNEDESEENTLEGRKTNKSETLTSTTENTRRHRVCIQLKVVSGQILFDEENKS